MARLFHALVILKLLLAGLFVSLDFGLLSLFIVKCLLFHFSLASLVRLNVEQLLLLFLLLASVQLLLPHKLLVLQLCKLSVSFSHFIALFLLCEFLLLLAEKKFLLLYFLFSSLALADLLFQFAFHLKAAFQLFSLFPVVFLFKLL